MKKQNKNIIMVLILITMLIIMSFSIYGVNTNLERK